MAKSASKAATAKRLKSSQQTVRSKPAGARKSRGASTVRTVKALAKTLGTTSPQHKDSKQRVVLGMLGDESGATIEAIVKATHWQPHSVRGFFAGVVRKKLGLELTSERVDGVRVYRIQTQRVAGQIPRP